MTTDVEIGNDSTTEMPDPAENHPETRVSQHNRHGAYDDDGDAVMSEVVEHLSRGGRPVRMAVAFCAVAIVGMSALCGWFGFQLHQSHRDQRQAERFLQAGQQAAVNLTTISFTKVDMDVQRVLNSATGAFHDDFEKRSQPFIDLVKQTRSETKGKVTAAGLESCHGNQGRVLVAVSVDTSTGGSPERQPRMWRMHVDLVQTGDDVKVSNVGFEP